MKAVLNIPDKDISFVFDNLTVDQYRVVGERILGNNVIEKYTSGDTIVLVTSNMPHELKNQIVVYSSNKKL